MLNTIAIVSFAIQDYRYRFTRKLLLLMPTLEGDYLLDPGLLAVNYEPRAGAGGFNCQGHPVYVRVKYSYLLPTYLYPLRILNLPCHCSSASQK